MRNHIRQVAHVRDQQEAQAKRDADPIGKPAMPKPQGGNRKNRRAGQAFNRLLGRRLNKDGHGVSVKTMPDGGIHVTVKGDKPAEGILRENNGRLVRTGVVISPDKMVVAQPSPDGEFIQQMEDAMGALTLTPEEEAIEDNSL